MTSYLLRRIPQALAVLIGVSLISFILLHMLPGGPARASLGPRATPTAIHIFNTRFGLLKPLPIQYLDWLNQLVHGNLGYSYKQNQSVESLLAQNIPRTLVLVGISTLLALAVAIPIGIYQAARRNQIEDYLLTGLAFLFYSMPTFFLGIILIILFSQILPIFPSTGPSITSPLFTQIPNLVLPIATLTLVTVALFSRYIRAAVLDNLVQDYVRTARANGASFHRILFTHVLRNALLPVVTLLGLSLPWILSGALIIEALFNYPGMGFLFWTAAQTEDFPVMLGTTVVVGVGVVVGSLLADVLYAALDPRVRYR